MTDWHELFVFLGALAASAFALARQGLAHQRALLDRFAGELGDGLRRQEAANARLAEAVAENTLALMRLAERFRDREDAPWV
jgi:hypothetical protein